MGIAVLAITRNGVRLGKRLCEGLPAAELLVSSRYAGQAGPGQRAFPPEQLRELVSTLWSECEGLVFIMAAGIVVRMIAPLLKGKDQDPAVVVMDDAGRFSVSLLSGHLGGANELAERCAFVTGSRAVITTATDANDLPSFDMLAREQGWAIDDLSRVKTLNRLLLDGEEIAVVDSSGQARSWARGRGRLVYHDTIGAALESGAAGCVCVTNRSLPPESLREELLILRPRNLVLGIGCNRGTAADEIDAFVCGHLERLSLSMKSVRCVASVSAKSDEAGLLGFARRHSLGAVFYGGEELNGVAFPSPPSQHALAAVGAAGVAEPAAILASGNGTLLLKKVKSDNVTLAVAEMGEA